MGNRFERLKRQLSQLDGWLVEWDTDTQATQICGLIGILDEELKTFYDGHRNEHRTVISLQVLSPTGQLQKVLISEEGLDRFLTTGILGLNIDDGPAYKDLTVRVIIPLPVFEDVPGSACGRHSNP